MASAAGATQSRALSGPLKLVGSSIGAKVVMAVTGLILSVFVLGHMVGNLQIFLGPEAINRYGAFLQGLGELLWLIRLVLLATVVIHVASAARLVILNRQARPIGYVHGADVQVAFAARTMPWTGMILLAFIVYHLAHFTAGRVQPELFGFHDELGRHDIYAMVVLGFQDWFVTGCYVIANALLALHMSHGVSSMFQSFGVTTPSLRRPLVDLAGPAIGTLVLLGNLSIPLACWLGLLELPYGAM